MTCMACGRIGYVVIFWEPVWKLLSREEVGAMADLVVCAAEELRRSLELRCAPQASERAEMALPRLPQQEEFQNGLQTAKAGKESGNALGDAMR